MERALSKVEVGLKQGDKEHQSDISFDEQARELTATNNNIDTTSSSRMPNPVVAHTVSVYYSLTENWLQTQITHLSRYKPVVITQTTENLPDTNGVECYALRERPSLERFANRMFHRGFGYNPSFYRFIRRKRARLIHAHFGNMGYQVLPLAKAAGLPLITMFYGYDASLLPKREPIWRTRYKKLFQFGKKFLAEGNHMGKQLIGLGCPEEKVAVHHLGVRLDEYEFKPRTRAVDEPLRILVAGRFTEKKGIVFALEAFFRIVKNGVNARLTIIGDSGNKPKNLETKKQIVDVVARNGALSNFVEFRGLRPLAELRAAYHEHHIFLSPSVEAESGDNEGGAPVSLIEAAATGMPIVATYHCDIPEVVKHGITGLLAPERDSETLANHLMAFVSGESKLAEMGAAARKHIENEYDALRQGERLEALYDEVLSE